MANTPTGTSSAFLITSPKRQKSNDRKATKRTNLKSLKQIRAIETHCGITLRRKPTESRQPDASSFHNIILEKSSFATTTNYDITEDGVVDEIRLRFEKDSTDWISIVRIFVNGELARTVYGSVGDGTPIFGVKAKYLQLSTGKQFLYLACIGVNLIGKYDVLKFVNGKLVALAGNKSVLTKGHNEITRIKAVKDRIKIEHQPMIASLGAGFRVTFSYKYSNGKLKRSCSNSTTFEYWSAKSKRAKPWLTAARSFKAYRNADCTKAKAKIKRNTKVKILKVHAKPNGQLCFYAKKKSGAKFWFKNPLTLTHQEGEAICLFKESRLAR